MIIYTYVEDEKWGCSCNCHTSTPEIFSSGREVLRGLNSWPRKDEFEVRERRCCCCCRSPWLALVVTGCWGPLAGDVSLEALVDWKDTDMPESREPTLPRRTDRPPPSVNHTTTYTTARHFVYNHWSSNFVLKKAIWLSWILFIFYLWIF